MTTGRDEFDVRSKWAVTVDEMMRHLNELQPTIIHFSGHGSRRTRSRVQDERRSRSPSRRDVETRTAPGIQLQDEDGELQYVSARALTQIIGSASSSARLVVLNTCFGDDLADVLLEVVDCVVGMRGVIHDDAARSFAVGFYRALGNRKSIGNAVDQGIATLVAKRLAGERVPVCRARRGVVAGQLFLSPLRSPANPSVIAPR